jgi:outer membrane protein
MKKLLLAIAVGGLFVTSASVMAQASAWSGSIGITRLSPSDSSGSLSAPALPNTRVDVGDATALTGALNYRVSDSIGIQVPLGYGFKHNIVGAGNPSIAALGKLGDVKVLPFTVIGQYKFLDPASTFRPYLGAGLTYAKFYGGNTTAALTAATNPGGPATTMKTDSKLAPTFQVGGTYNINSIWYVEAHYSKTLLKTTAHLSTGQEIGITLNPNAYSLQLGYRF